MDESRRIEYEHLTQFCMDALQAVGAPQHVAQIEGDIAAEVDLHGVHSHGVRLLLNVIDNVRQGRTNPDPQIETLAEFPAALLAQTERGIGRYVSAVGMDRALDKAEQFGIGCVTIRGVGHWGRGHSYALRAARRGLIGLAFTNAIANFPAWGTAVPSLGNNPLAIGVPAGPNEEPAVLDIAMTQTSIGRVRGAAAAGQTIPPGWGLDKDGTPTTDPNAVLESGRFLPMGAHKGSGLAFMTDLLTAGLANGLLCFEQGTQGRPSDTEGGSTKVFIAIQPFGDWLHERVAALKAHIHAAPPAPEQGAVRWPGESSVRRRQDYLAEGIRLDPHIVADMDALAQELDVAVQWQGA